MSKPYPHERRIQRFAYVALAACVGLAAALVLQGEPRVLGADVGALPWALLALGAIALAIAIARRTTWLAFVGGALLALAVVPAAQPRPGVAGYALGLGFGAALLAAAELIHMMERYEKAHRAVDSEGVPEDHINKVTDESLRTLGTRALLALTGCAAAIGAAFFLSLVGPRQWRAAAETTAPLGVAVMALALAGIVSLFILARGARLRRDEEKPLKEVLPDVAE